MALDLTTGSVFAGYRIEELIGRGGMGVVYRAIQLAVGRPVALKLIVPEHAADDRFRLRFEREWRLAAQLEHPNVIPVYEAGESDGALFISMRYVQGVDLRDRLLELGRLAPEHAAQIVAQVASALDAAHERGLVHRDVKPANVLLQVQRGSEHPYLTDFGLTKQASSDSGLTRSGDWVGTLDYVAPEQLRGDPVDARTDVYALGCVLYELLTGRVPFPRDADAARMWAHISDPPPPLSQEAPRTAGVLDDVVARALAKRPADRYASAGDLGRAALAAASGAAPPSEQGSVATGAADARAPVADQRAPTKGSTAATAGPQPPRGATPSAPRSGVRRAVTVVFCEVTPAVEPQAALDPEALRHVMSRAGEVARSTFEHHGGTVQTYVGDAVIAVFGLPSLHEDDALRAARAVDDLRTRVASVQEDLRPGGGWSLDLRAGLCTGDVVTGDPAHGQPLVSGEAVTIAARLGQAAAPGQVLVASDTYGLIGGAVQAEPVEPVVVPARAEPVRAFELREVDPQAPGVARRLDSPIVARERELERLNEAFGQVVDENSLQLVAILGPAGVGKSRLTREFLRCLGERVTTLVGRCLPYGEGITFWPVAEVVREAAGISEEDSPSEARSKIAALVPRDEDEELIVDRVSAALGLSAGPAPPEELFWAIRRLLEAVASDGPLVLVLDDIHWAEPTFLDLVEHLVTFSRAAPILVLVMSRPELREERPSLLGPATRSLLLGPLDEQASDQLMRNLLGAGELTEDVTAVIGTAAGGNPLYLEEMLRMLIDDGLLAPENGGWRVAGDLTAVKVPPSIQALIAARLERLEPDELPVLEHGAVIGQEFPRAALRDLLPEARRRDLGYRLDGFERKELVEPTDHALLAEDGYRFSHILIREVTYQGVLRATRSELHERFAGWLEQRLGERSREYDELIGHHLEQAYRDLEAVTAVDGRGRRLARAAAERLGSAGDRAGARGDMPAAANLLGRAESLLEAGDEKRELQLKLGLVLAELGEATRAEAVLGAAAEAATAAGDRRVEMRAALERSYWRLGTGTYGSTDELRRVAEQAVSTLTELGDEAGVSRAWSYLAFVDSTACRWAAATQSLEQALAHARAAGDTQQETELLLYLTGALQYGPTPAEEGIRRLREMLDPSPYDSPAAIREPMSATNRALVEASGLAGLEAMRGNFEDARELSDRAKDICEEFGQTFRRAIVGQVSGLVELLADVPAAAEAELRRSYEILDEMGETGYLSTTAALLGEALYAQGRLEDANDMTTVTERSAVREDLVSHVLWRATRGKVAARNGDAAEGERLVRDAVTLAAETDDLNLHADTLAALAEVLLRQGRPEDALAAISEAIAMYEQKGNRVSARRATALRESV